MPTLHLPEIDHNYSFTYPDFAGGRVYRRLKVRQIRENWHSMTLIEGIDLDSGSPNAWYLEHMEDLRPVRALMPQRLYHCHYEGKPVVLYVNSCFPVVDACGDFWVTGTIRGRFVSMQLSDLTFEGEVME